MKATGAVAIASLLCGLCSQAVLAQQHQPPLSYQVLVVHSSYQGDPWTDSVTRGIRAGFAGAPELIDVQFEYIDMERYRDPTYLGNLHAFWQSKFGNQHVDLIITGDNDAYDFVENGRDALFAAVPLVFTGFNDFEPTLLTGKSLVTGVVEENDFAATIDVALQLHPNARKIAFVTPGAPPGRMTWINGLADSHPQHANFINITAEKLANVERELVALGPEIVVIPLNSVVLKSGRYMPFDQFVSHLANVGKFPMYGLWDIAFGHGIVGGKLISGEVQGSEAARLALKILRGTPVSDVPVVANSTNRYMFDWLQLQRFDIDMNDLPEGSIVLNQPKSIYREHKDVVWSAGTLVALLSALIVLLALTIARRKQTERVLRKSEERYAFAISGTAEGLWDWDTQTGESYLSPRWKAILGYEDHELENRIETLTNALHPDDRVLVTTMLQKHIKERTPFSQEFRLRCKNSDYVWVLSRGQMAGGQGDAGHRMVGSISNVSERKQAEAALSFQATHDALTGLINRPEFERQLTRVLDTMQTEHALCYLDLDQFKIVNDTCGHMAGDELLRQVAQVLTASVRKRDTLARLGGDEFGVLMEHCSPSAAHRVAENLRNAVAQLRFAWAGRVFELGVSIGLVPIGQEGGDIDAVLSAADSACYVAKDQGRNRIHVHRSDDSDLASRDGEMQWVERINRALEEDRFQLWSQALLPVAANSEEGEQFELLLRLIDESGKCVLPETFLPAAERYGLSTKIDQWVVNAAFDWLKKNPKLLEALHRCFINISGISLADESFFAFVQEQFEFHLIPPSKICFEITETAAIANLSKGLSFMERLSAQGCKFALDDFGSGMSSFAYLKTLPVDYLKIDGAFVKGIIDDDIDLALVRSINDVGKVMGKATIAKFVENERILDELRRIGVDYAQGYGISCPSPIEQSVDVIGAKTLAAAKNG